MAANYFAILAELKGVSVEALLQGMQGESGSSRGVAPAVELPAKERIRSPSGAGGSAACFTAGDGIRTLSAASSLSMRAGVV